MKNATALIHNSGTDHGWTDLVASPDGFSPEPAPRSYANRQASEFTIRYVQTATPRTSRAQAPSFSAPVQVAEPAPETAPPTRQERIFMAAGYKPERAPTVGKPPLAARFAAAPAVKKAVAEYRKAEAEHTACFDRVRKALSPRLESERIEKAMRSAKTAAEVEQQRADYDAAQGPAAISRRNAARHETRQTYAKCHAAAVTALKTGLEEVGKLRSEIETSERAFCEKWGVPYHPTVVNRFADRLESQIKGQIEAMALAEQRMTFVPPNRNIPGNIELLA